MSTSPGSILAAMALTSFGPEEPGDAELPLPVFPLFPELAELPPPKNGEPFRKGFPEEPEPAGSRVLPEAAADGFEVPLVQAAWPMATPPARRAKAATPARTPLRT